MNAPILTAIIALTGILLSVLASVITSRLTVKARTTEVKLQVRQMVAAKLLDARLKIYPELSYFLSDFAKQIYQGGITGSNLASLLNNLSTWDSKNSVFLSPHAASCCYYFRQYVGELIKSHVQGKTISKEICIKLLEDIGDFEIALRTDIGIYGVTFSKEHDDFSGKSSLYW
jgi:hypothetical protein